jgi:eukaryotic-like serine/threonine-protein kinase
MTDPPRKPPDPDETAPMTKKETPLDPLIGKTLDGRFTPRALLGRGGMGRVYLAEDVRLKRRVALKLMDAGLEGDSEFAQRFKREALVQAQAAHPGIVQVLDAGDCPEGAYIVLEYSEGRSLSTLLKVGPIRRERALDFTEQLLDVLDFAHRQGVVHRDLKPGNILIEDRGGREIVRVLDFGIAKLLRTETQEEGQTLTKTGFGFGTPGYMSLEQATGRPTDHRTDIYAAGVILYQMLGGVLPLAASSMSDYLVKLAATEPKPLGEVRPDLGVPEALDDLVLKALAREPDDRYASALHFLEAIREFRRGEEASTGATYVPKSAAVSAARKAAKPKTGVVVATVASCSLVAFAGGFVLGGRRGGDGPTPAELAAARSEAFAEGAREGRASVRDALKSAGFSSEAPEKDVAARVAELRGAEKALESVRSEAARFALERDRERDRAERAERNLAVATSDAASASREAAALREAAGRPDALAEGLREDLAAVRRERDDYRTRLDAEEAARRSAETASAEARKNVERVEAELAALKAAAERAPSTPGSDGEEVAALRAKVQSLTRDLEQAKAAAAGRSSQGSAGAWAFRLENGGAGTFELKDLSLFCAGPSGEAVVTPPPPDDPRVLAGKSRVFSIALPGPILRAEGRLARVRPGGAVPGSPEPFKKSEFAIRGGEIVLTIK